MSSDGSQPVDALLRVNELKPELLGIHALNPFAMNNSASRGFMFSSHLTQHLVIEGLEERIIYAGPEQEWAKYTLGVRMPANGRIIRVIDRYPQGIGQDSLNLNPESLVIYEKTDPEHNGEIDCFLIPMYRSFHQYFGWRCVAREGMDLLRHTSFIPKDTVFVDTPGVKDGNSYMYGINTNVAYMATPGVAEDGIVASRSFLKRCKHHIYETRIVEWGNSKFPLHLYGPGRCFPEIGEWISPDGLLMALRPYDLETHAVDIGINDVQVVNHVFDQKTYVTPGRGRIVDIEIYANNEPIKNCPTGISAQADKYVAALVRYNREIIDVEEKLNLERKRKYGIVKGNLNLSPAFSRLLVRARAVVNHNGDKMRQTLRLTHRKEKIDEYYAKFVIEYEITPDKGDKFSNSSGSKGVVCKVIENDEDMPVRPDGVRADVIIDPGPVFHRMNLGQSFEQYMTCAAYDVTLTVALQLGLIKSKLAKDFENRQEVTQDQILAINRDLFDDVYDYLMGFYRVFNDIMPDWFSNLSIEDKAEHICDIINEGCCKIFLPVDNKRLPADITLDLERLFKPTMTTVVYKAPSGIFVETFKKIRIAKVYMFLLDKMAREWSATPAARLQHFGILSSVTKSEKHAYPFRNSPTRLIGETESRLISCYPGAEALAEMFDRTNNPLTRRMIYWNILSSDKPSAIERIVDRNLVPLGASKPIQIVNHIFMCAGFKPEYLPDIVESIQKSREDKDDDVYISP